MELLVDVTGNVRCIYDETLDLNSLGQLHIQRGSHVEPTADGRWTADMSPVNGPVLGPFLARSSALEAERSWLLDHWLIPE
jgi:hypothetical protein